MLFSLISRVICSTGVFLYPGYASYKALSKRPAEQTDLERWLMYWSVLASILAVEYVAEWAISWIPFYYTIKTTFLLFLALPQTQGSTYIFRAHLAPALSTYEPQIDAALAQLKTQIYLYLQERLKMVWDLISASLVTPPPQAVQGAAGGAAQPTIADPVSGPINMAWGVWRTYAPIVIAQGSAFIAARQAQARQQEEEANAQREQRRQQRQQLEQDSSPTPSAPPLRDTASILARRRQLEAELASLPQTPAGEETGGYSMGASTYLHREEGEGRYEDITRDELGDSADEATRDELGTPSGRQSWWGGWGSATKGYEKLKDQ